MTDEAQQEGSPARSPGPDATAANGLGPRERDGFFSAVGRGALLLIKTAVPVAVLGAAFLAFQYMVATRPEVVRTPVEEKVYFVDTVTAAKHTISPQLVLYGNVVAGREVELRPLVTGRVVRVAKTFSDGGIVRKGDLLVEIDPFDYQIAVTERKTQLSESQARLTEIEADLEGEQALIRQGRNQIELRQQDLARQEALLEQGAGTAKLLDNSKLALSTQQQNLDERIRRSAILEARLGQQKAVIARAELALTRAEQKLRDTRLVAPFDGFLRDISTGIGKKVGVNDKIARLTDAARFEAEFQVSDAQYGRLVREGRVIGRPASVVWQTGSENFTFPATIARVSGRVSSTSGGVNLFARLQATDTTTLLRPGVFVEVRMADTTYPDVFRLPDDALIDSQFVYVAADERLMRRPVTVAGRVGNDILVRGEIADGDQVVARTFPEIGPGLKVSVLSVSARDTQ